MTVGLPCHARGPKEAWKTPKDRFPICNRPDGHEGNHKAYSQTALVLAEWEVPVE